MDLILIDYLSANNIGCSVLLRYVGEFVSKKSLAALGCRIVLTPAKDNLTAPCVCPCVNGACGPRRGRIRMNANASEIETKARFKKTSRIGVERGTAGAYCIADVRRVRILALTPCSGHSHHLIGHAVGFDLGRFIGLRNAQTTRVRIARGASTAACAGSFAEQGSSLGRVLGAGEPVG
jgi:hypothetical protein